MESFDPSWIRVAILCNTVKLTTTVQHRKMYKSCESLYEAAASYGDTDSLTKDSVYT